MSNILAVEDVRSLINKAQSIINFAPELSLKYILLAEKQADKNAQKEYFGIFNKIIGECFLLLEDYESAGPYIFKAENFFNINDNPIETIESKILLANWYNKTGDKNKAIEIFNQMIISSTAIGFNEGVIRSLYHMSILYIGEGNFYDAKEILGAINSDDLDGLTKDFIINFKLRKVHSLIKCNEVSNLESLLAECLDESLRLKDSNLIKKSYENYYAYYKLIDDTDKAFYYLEKTYNIAEEIINDVPHAKIAKLLTQYEVDKKEQIIYDANKKNKELEEANSIIRKQKLLLETILDTIPNPIYYKDVKGKYLGFNRSWNETFNKGQASKLSKTVHEISTDFDALKFEEHDQDLLYNKHLMKLETKMVLSDNKEHDLIFYKDVFRDEKGAVAGIIGVINDVSELKQISQEIKRANNFLSAIVNLAPVGICILTKTGKINYANNYLRDLMYYDGNLNDISIYNFVVDTEIAEFKSKLLDVNPNKEVIETEVRMTSTEGTIVYVNVLISLLSLGSQDDDFYLCVINNITDRKIYDESLRRSENELKEANSTKDRLFAIIAHDLRGPIGNFREIFRLLATNRKIFSVEEQTSLMEELHKSADYTFDLLENLLQWSRNQRDELKLVANFHSIYDVFQLVCRELKGVYDTKKISIVNQIKVPHIGFFDKNMISVVLRNLMSNAVKFSYPNSQVLVSSIKHEDYIEVIIADQGIGIEKDDIEKIFSSIDNKSSLGTARERGTGLGLVLCKSFVEKNSGNIWVESEVGKGSTFHFTIPIENNANH